MTTGVIVGSGVRVKGGVRVGVRVGVLLGGSVGVTRTKSGSAMVGTRSGDVISDVETGITIGEGLGLRKRVATGVLGAIVTSWTKRGRARSATLLASVPHAANIRMRMTDHNGRLPRHDLS